MKNLLATLFGALSLVVLCALGVALAFGSLIGRAPENGEPVAQAVPVVTLQGPAYPGLAPILPAPAPTLVPYPGMETAAVVATNFAVRTSPPSVTPKPSLTTTPTMDVILRTVPVPRLEGDKIAFLRDRDVWLIKPSSRASARVTVSGNVSRIFGWSQEDKLLLGVGERPVLPESDGPPTGRDLWVLDVAGGEATQFTQGLNVLEAAWSPVDSRIAYSTRSGSLYIAETKNDHVELPGKGFGPFAWAPDGTKLAFIVPPPTWEPWALTDVFNIAVFHTEERSVDQLTSDNWANFNPIWSLDGKRILFESERPCFEPTRHALSETSLWYVMDSDGGNLRYLQEVTLRASSNAERSNLADLVAFEVSGEIWVMDFDGRAMKVAAGTHPTWSPDGNRFAYVTVYGRLMISDVNNNGETSFDEIVQQPYWSH